MPDDSPQSIDDKIAQLFEQAAACEKDEEAIQIYSQIIQILPEELDIEPSDKIQLLGAAYTFRGTHFLNLQDIEKAFFDLSSATHLGKHLISEATKPSDWYGLALSIRGRLIYGESKEAAIVDHIAAINYGDDLTIEQRGRWYYESHHEKAAILIVKAELGNDALKEEYFTQAAEHLKIAAGFVQDNPIEMQEWGHDVFRTFASLHLCRQEFDKAAEYYKISISNNMRDACALLGACQASKKSGDIMSAHIFYELAKNCIEDLDNEKWQDLFKQVGEELPPSTQEQQKLILSAVARLVGLAR